MDPHAATELIQAVAATAAIRRIVSLNLSARFPAILSYLVFLAVINLGFGLMNQASEFYFWTYLVLEPLKCLLSIVAVREILTLTFDDYPGIRTVGRWALYGGLALALTVSLLLTRFFWSSGAEGRAHSRLYYFEVSQRSIVFTLAVVIITILLCLSKYPLHLSRNTLVSNAFFSILFLSEASRLLVDSLMPRLYNDYVDWTEAAVVSVCLVGWTILLQPEKEKVPARVTFSTPQDDVLLEQLRSLNQMMTRAARR